MTSQLPNPGILCQFITLKLCSTETVGPAPLKSTLPGLLNTQLSPVSPASAPLSSLMPLPLPFLDMSLSPFMNRIPFGDCHINKDAPHPTQSTDSQLPNS